MPENEDLRDFHELLLGRDYSVGMMESEEDAVNTARVYSRCHQMNLGML